MAIEDINKKIWDILKLLTGLFLMIIVTLFGLMFVYGMILGFLGV